MIQKLSILTMIALLGLVCAAWTADAVAKDASSAQVSSAPTNTVKMTTVEAAAAYLEDAGYQIGPGDVVDISVWKDEALTRSCVVRPDGVLSFPLVGEVQAGGRTVSELKTEMEKKLASYIPDLVLTVDVKQVNSMLIYVIGKVNAPGRFVMNTNVNVLQALATAGGLNVFANGNKIKIFRNRKDETVIFPFAYDEVMNGKHILQNIGLKGGDIVVVP